MLEKGEGAHYEWNHKGKGEHVVFHSLSGFLGVELLVNINFNDIVDNDKASDDNSLSNFDAVNPRIYINRIGAEDGYVAHIDVV